MVDDFDIGTPKVGDLIEFRPASFFRVAARFRVDPENKDSCACIVVGDYAGGYTVLRHLEDDSAMWRLSGGEVVSLAWADGLGNWIAKSVE